MDGAQARSLSAHPVTFTVLIILVGVVLIDAKLRKMVLAQRHPYRRVEELLSEIRDRSAGRRSHG